MIFTAAGGLDWGVPDSVGGFPRTHAPCRRLRAANWQGCRARPHWSFVLSFHPDDDGATLYTLLKSLSGKDENPIGVAQITPHQWSSSPSEFVVSFIVAYGAVAWFMNWVRKRGLRRSRCIAIVLGIAVLA